MSLKFKFTDYSVISKPTEKDLELWADFAGQDNPMVQSLIRGVNMSKEDKQKAVDFGKGLRVEMEATHAGIINKNLRAYLPSRMKDGVDYIKSLPKPLKILKHHEVGQDPVGIVRDAEWVSTVPEELSDNPDVMTIMSETAGIKDQLKSLRNLIKSGVLLEDGWKGFGHIKLHTDIIDPEAVFQIQTGLFDAVSTNFSSPGQAYCSSCDANWAVGEDCDHEVGEIFEDEDGVSIPTVIVPGVHKYKECSLVNMDADPFTLMTVSDSENESNDKVFSFDDGWKDAAVNENKLVFEFKDFKEDNMAKPIDEGVVAVLEILKKLRPEGEEKSLQDKAVKISALKLEDGNYPDQAEAGIDEETAILYALEEMENVDSEVNADELYEQMTDGLGEAKLTTESLGKLSDSIFCGPDRTFPVPDCAHVDPARKLIGNYSGPGSKTTILANINKKATALGYEEPVADSQEEPPKEDVSLSDEELKQSFQHSEAEMIKRGLTVKRECSACAEAADLLKEAKDSLLAADQKIQEFETTLSVLRDELRRQMTDYAAQVDGYVDLQTQLHTAKAQRVALMGVISGKFESVDKAMESLKDSNLETEEAALSDSFDLEAIVTKMNDGMTREPEEGEAIDDPTLNIDSDNVQLPEQMGKPAEAALQNIKEYLADGQTLEAKKLYDRMKSLKLFSDSITFEQLINNSAVKDSADDES